MLAFRPGETPSWQINLFEDDLEAAALDCTAATLAVEASDLGFIPAIAWTDRLAGAAFLSMTAAQTNLTQRRRRYWLRLRLELPGPEIIVLDDIPIMVPRLGDGLPQHDPVGRCGPLLVENAGIHAGVTRSRVALRFSKLGLRGLPGAPGATGQPGPQGDPALNEDPGDLTLIFDNQLI